MQNCFVPDVIGCIDGTHVRIQAPAHCEDDYVNRKQFHSLNVQVSIGQLYSFEIIGMGEVMKIMKLLYTGRQSQII